MARDFYIAPAGSGTSGTGTSRSNPIVGLADVNSNVIGAGSGDRLIFLPGTHYEQFVVPASGLTLVSEDTIWDGTDSINGSARLNASTFWHESTGSAWQQVSVNPNIWKKGCGVAGFTFMDGVWLEPMPTSLSTNNYATHVLPVIGINEITVLNETLDGGNRAFYIRLPLGDSPHNHDIRISGRRISATTVQSGLIEAVGKSDLKFEGQFNVFGYYNMSSHSAPFLFKQCTGIRNDNGNFNATYSQWGTWLVAPSDVSIRAKGEYLLGACVAIGSADEVTGTTYTGGDVDIYDWYANYCGWMPRYNYVDLRYGDADGGVAVGYKGGSLNNITIRHGTSINGGPSVNVLKTGWLGSLNIGSGIFFGTGDPLIVNGDVKVFGNKIESAKRNSIAVGGSNILYKKSISINNNYIKNHRAMTLVDNVQTEILLLRVIKVGSTVTKQSICNNTISGGNHTVSAIGAGNSQALSTPIEIVNNIVQGCSLVSGYASNYGMFRVIDANTSVTINGNIMDISDGGAIGKVGTSSVYTTMSAWRAAGYDVNGQQGTVTIAQNGAPSAGTANPIGTGTKYWLNARPSDLYGEPLPDTNIDIGAVQSTNNALHPKNLINSTNSSASLLQQLSYSPAEIESQLDKVTELDSRLDNVEVISQDTISELNLSKFIIPSIFSGDKEAATTVASELMADNLLKIVVKNLSLTNSAYIGIGTSAALAEGNCSTGTAWVNRFLIPANTDATIFMGTNVAYAWKSVSGSCILNITQCR